MDRSRSIVASPMNLIAYIFYLYWYAFETIAWVFTFGHRQFNEEYFNPLTLGPHQYCPDDRIRIIQYCLNTFEQKGQHI